jgi:hypothetical protein
MALEPNEGNLSEYLSENNNLLEEVKDAVEGSEIDITTLAKEAKQDAQIVLETDIKAAILALAKLTDTQPISAASLPLPSGASSASNQALEIAAIEQLGKQSFLSQVALLRIAGIKNFRKQGENASVTTSVLPINQGGTPIVPLAVAAKISFVSNNANDTAAGTGARTLRIFGVGTGGTEQTEDLILNGTTPVLTALDYVGILNRVFVLTVGGGATKSNIGTITGTSGGNTYCTMLAGDSTMKQIAYYVPNNKTACIYSYLIDASKNAGATVVFDVHFYVLQNGVKYELFSFKIDQGTGLDNSMQRAFATPLPITENSIWWFEAKTSSGTAFLSGEVEQVIFDDL